jgi:hypothetical protein
MHKIFVDPSIVGPRELDSKGMSDLSGAGAAAPVLFATACGEGLAALVAVGIDTVIDP